MPASKTRLGFSLLQWGGLVLAIACFAIPWMFTFEGLSEPGHRMLAIFMLAVVLWITEAIPLHATAAVIILSSILLVSDHAMLPLPETFKAPPYSRFFDTLANPVLMLFLGGFFLADGAARFRLDRNLARVLLKPFGEKPAFIILGLMVITACFSMFMSNTATAATMMAVVLPVVARLAADDKSRIALVLCVPIAANIGGMGTPVGTPPNAIALGALQKAGLSISFIHWMAMVVPFMLLTLLFAWQLLVRLYPSREAALRIDIGGDFDRSPRAILFYAIAGATILLWFTEPLHGIPSSIVGFLPVTVMLAARLVSEREFHAMQWSVLWLVAGGIALGAGVAATGLDAWMIGLVNWQHVPTAWLGGALALTALLLSTIISNSATANLLVPIGITLAASPEIGISPVLSAVCIAIGASLAMALPISTPPNAIAYSTGAVPTKAMALAGAGIGVFGLVIFVTLAPWCWKLFGLMPS